MSAPTTLNPAPTLVPTAPAGPEDRLIDVESLSVTFHRPGARGQQRREVRAVRGLDLSIAPGEAVGIVGESGSGKSVTARTLIGLTGGDPEISATRLEVAGQDATALTDAQWHAIRGRCIGLILQDALTSLDPLRTIGKEIAEALHLSDAVNTERETAGDPLLTGRALAAAEREAAITLLEEVGIPEADLRVDQYPHELSGGLRQRALIASAIAGRPDLIIADEPTTALDVTVQAQVLDLLVEVRARTGAAIVFISHDLGVVYHLADDVLVMKDGQVVESGDVDAVFTWPTHPYTRRLLEALPTLPEAEAA